MLRMTAQSGDTLKGECFILCMTLALCDFTKIRLCFGKIPYNGADFVVVMLLYRVLHYVVVEKLVSIWYNKNSSNQLLSQLRCFY